jgi:hypothetical protein
VTPDRQKVNTGYAASMAAAADIKRMIGWGVPGDDSPVTSQIELTLPTLPA